MRSCFCSAADTARPTASRNRRGTCSAGAPPAPRASRRSATTSIATSRSTIRTRARRGRRGRPSQERKGVCRDYAHLAVALLPLHEHPGALLHRLSRRHRRRRRPMARWISPPGSRPTSAGAGTPSTPATTSPRIGRVLMARGRDATDVAISNTFGPNTLAGFTVWAENVTRPRRLVTIPPDHAAPDRPARHHLLATRSRCGSASTA